jgi:DNA polymerase-3 subunit gamma/tau
VFIIDEVHMLSTAAFNAFLKTLEEPPAHAIFILATTEKHKILPTILSRCQIYDFNRIKVDDAVGYLKYIATQEGVTFDEESLNLIAQKADGGMRDALSMFDKAVSFCGQTLDYRSVAQTLNVLDYDTYFSVTEMLLGGDYLAALRLFDEVLSKGFSGQTFMSGLSQHMRDLLVARDTASLSLVELTGVLLERYQQQAKRCPVPFLFGAISLLSEADSRIRQSSNQRLLVELGLMKIAGLGQKKNNDIVAPATPQYSLPTLGVASTKSVSQSVEVTGATSQPQGAMSTNDTTASATPLQVTKSVAEESLKVSATTPISTVNPTTVPKTTKSHSSRATLIGGQSINDLMTQSRSSEVDVAASESTPTNESIDAQCEQKLQAHRSEILDYIERERPRLYAFFEQMTLANHTLTVLVPSESLKEEILRNKLDILPQVAQIAGVACTLELEVKVVETMKASKPIKLEDRIQYMSEQNPLFVEMRRVLDLEVEN